MGAMASRPDPDPGRLGQFCGSEIMGNVFQPEADDPKPASEARRIRTRDPVELDGGHGRNFADVYMGCRTKPQGPVCNSRSVGRGVLAKTWRFPQPPAINSMCYNKSSGFY